MALRGKKATELVPRFKALMSAEAGVGKTRASILMPSPYIIDSENGTAHYGELIEKAGGAVFRTQSFDEVIEEIKTLSSESHQYKTLVIDSITPIWDNMVEKGFQVKGTDDFGKDRAWAGTHFKRLSNLLMQIDMNVIVTAHSKPQYENKKSPEGKVQIIQVGETFDSWKKLDYIFDLHLILSRDKNDPTCRNAFVKKTRLPGFPDQEIFRWSYDSIADRYGREKLERGIETVEFASLEQVRVFNSLLSQLTDEDVKRWKIDKVLDEYGSVEDIPAERIEKAIGFLEEKLKSISA